MSKTTSTQLTFENQRIQKSSNQSNEQIDSTAEQLFKLEIERQEVLGKISFLTPKNPEYDKLDQRFNELTKAIKSLQQ